MAIGHIPRARAALAAAIVAAGTHVNVVVAATTPENEVERAAARKLSTALRALGKQFIDAADALETKIAASLRGQA